MRVFSWSLIFSVAFLQFEKPLSFKNRLSVSDPTNLLLTADLHTPHTMPSLTAMYSSHCHSLNQAALQERLKFSPLNFLAGKL
jgi:hypothetical protein